MLIKAALYLIINILPLITFIITIITAFILSRKQNRFAGAAFFLSGILFITFLFIFTFTLLRTGGRIGYYARRVKRYLSSRLANSNRKDRNKWNRENINVDNEDYDPVIDNSKKNNRQTVIAIPQHEGYLIAVYKEAHKLYLYKSGRIIREYNVNLRNDLADRQVWEDDQTPEGIFKVISMDIVTNGWSRWMLLDTTTRAREIYVKNHKDGWERIRRFEARFGSLNSDDQIKEFNRQNRRQKMLRGIGIHGGGYYPGNDWVIGCVALSNKNVNELFDLLTHAKGGGFGTPVVIQD